MDKKLRHIFAIVSGIICFIVYLVTLHPGVAFIDCGELAAACYTFGVPHPTGYPIYLLIGYLFSHLPLPWPVVYKLNILSAVESTAAVIITYYSAFFLLDNLKFGTIKPAKKEPSSKEHTQPAGKHNINFYFLAAIPAVMSGLTKTVWFDATQTEVYALHSLFISLMFFYFLKVYFSLKQSSGKYWAILFLLVGLSAANHSTTIYFIPAIALLYYYQFKENSVQAKKVIKYAVLIIPGLLFYLVLIAAASAKPYLNWSDPVNMGNLLYHMRGSDFSQLMFSSTSTFMKNAGYFGKDFFQETAILPGIFGIVGLVYLWNLEKKLAILAYLLVAGCLLYSFNYSTTEILSFYLLAYYLIAFFVSAGIMFMFKIFKSKSPLQSAKLNPAVLFSAIVLVALSVGYNFKDNDNSKNYVNEDITVNTLNVLEGNSILLTYDYAFVYSASLYFQQVEKLRPDVKVFNVRFLEEPWYLKTIEKFYPDVYNNIRTDAEEYVKSRNSDESTRLTKLTKLVKSFIDNNAGKYPFYITVDIVLKYELNPLFAGYTLQPEGLAYRLKEKNSPYDSTAGLLSLNAKFRKYEPVGFHKNRMFVSTPGLYYETAFYHYKNKNYETAMKFLDKTLEFNSGFGDAVKLKNKIISEKKNK